MDADCRRNGVKQLLESKEPQAEMAQSPGSSACIWCRWKEGLYSEGTLNPAGCRSDAELRELQSAPFEQRKQLGECPIGIDDRPDYGGTNTAYLHYSQRCRKDFFEFFEVLFSR